METTSPLFIDIETVSATPSYQDLSPKIQLLWQKKAMQLGASTQQEIQDLFFEKAGIFAEFGKIIVVAMGYISKNQQQETLHLQSLASHNEKELLQQCKDILSKFPHNTPLCGHNSKEFDLPYLARRMVIHHIPLPQSLNTTGKKPWEVTHIDTMELWKFGDKKNYTSLDLLTSILDIPSSKDNMQGNQVNTQYHLHNNLESIQQYCMQDVIATTQLYRRLQYLPLLPDENIIKKFTLI